MRKHWNKFLTVWLLAAAMTMGSMTAFANETSPVVETITLDEGLNWESTVPADLGWKTAQDKGQWIEEMGIAKDMTSLILIIDNQDKEDPYAIPALAIGNADEDKAQEKNHEEKTRSAGNSRLSYFSKGMDGEWSEVFSVDCYLSSGAFHDKTALYGAYEPVRAFGNYENPGSLLPFRSLSSCDFWALNPEDEQYGSIFTVDSLLEKPKQAVSLEQMKDCTSYGMILCPEADYASCPVLMINCQQKGIDHEAVSGIGMPMEYVRMLIQSIDSETRIVIANSLDEMKDM